MDSYTTEFCFRNLQGGKLLDGKLVPVNFAMLVAAYGCKTYSVTTEQQLIEALSNASLQSVSLCWTSKFSSQLSALSSQLSALSSQLSALSSQLSALSSQR